MGFSAARTSNLTAFFDSPSRVRSTVHHVLCAMLCVLPALSGAAQIGDIVYVSKLGAPLYLEVAFTASANERVDSSCISLVAPDANTEDASQYLTANNAQLSVQNNGGQPRIVLNSRKPFNDVFAKFKLELKCQGQGSIAKTFTALPDIDSALPPETRVVIADPSTIPQVEPSAASTKTQQAAVVATPPPNFMVDQSTFKPRKRIRKASREFGPLRITRRAPSMDVFQLKISGDPLDASRIGKISDDERTFLLAKQKLLDSDDQMASILELQNQVKQLQDDIVAMKSQFAQLGVAPARVNLSAEVNPNESVAAVSAPTEVATTPAITTIKPSATQPSNWRTWAWQLGLLGLAILGVVWGLRRYADGKSANLPAQDMPEIISIRPATKAIEPEQVMQSIAAPVLAVDQSDIQPAAPGEMTTKVRAMAQAAVAAKSAPAYTHASSPQLVNDERSEVDAIIEEAQLYAAFNHPLRATKILHELLVDHPKKSEAWLLLLSILSSLKNEHEFENNARTFLRYNPKDHESWKTIQILGRTLNPTHALYRDNSPVLSPDTVLGDRSLLGDVLIDLEMISPESLHHCLAHFDPKQHGRFGAYLVTEKVITHEQLTQALVLQNTINQGAPYTPPADLEFAPPDRSWQG